MEGRLINYLVDCITSGRERDQAYAAVLLARLLTHVRSACLPCNSEITTGSGVSWQISPVVQQTLLQ